jgi:hypothetical protein
MAMRDREDTVAPLIALPLMMVATSATAQKFGLQPTSFELLRPQCRPEPAREGRPAPTDAGSISAGSGQR